MEKMIANAPTCATETKKRGRPSTGQAKSSAERQKDYRAREHQRTQTERVRLMQKYLGMSDMELWWGSMHVAEPISKDAWLELGRRRGWLK